MDGNRRQFLRGRLPLYLLVVGLAVLTVQYFQERPLEVSVVYRYGGRHAQLRAVSVGYERAGDVVATARYSYQSRPAGPEQRHDLSLVPGDYTVAIDLTYARSGGVTQSNAKTRSSAKDERSVHLVRHLKIQSEGEYSLYVDR